MEKTLKGGDKQDIEMGFKSEEEIGNIKGKNY